MGSWAPPAEGSLPYLPGGSAAAACSPPAQEAGDWNYKNNGADWTGDCGGSNQSPIGITTSSERRQRPLHTAPEAGPASARAGAGTCAYHAHFCMPALCPLCDGLPS